MTTQTLETTRQIFSVDWTPLPTLAEKIARTYARLFSKRYPEIAQACGSRLESAIRIIHTPGMRQQATNNLFLVRSEHNPNGWYQIDITAHTCTCPDHPGIAGRGGICKHRLAIGLVLRGPDWLIAEQTQLAADRNAHMREMAIYAAHQNEEIAWDKVIELTDRWEYLAWSLGPNDTKTGCARVELEIATRHAEQMSELARRF